MKVASQPDLFDVISLVEEPETAFARARMLEMIAQLKAATEPHWQDEMDVILDDGAFKRAMRLVPVEEAQTLWADFDAQTERLYAVWVRDRLLRPEAN
jgi:hypothetical protein